MLLPHPPLRQVNNRLNELIILGNVREKAAEFIYNPSENLNRIID